MKIFIESLLLNIVVSQIIFIVWMGEDIIINPHNNILFNSCFDFSKIYVPFSILAKNLLAY